MQIHQISYQPQFWSDNPDRERHYLKLSALPPNVKRQKLTENLLYIDKTEKQNNEQLQTKSTFTIHSSRHTT